MKVPLLDLTLQYKEIRDQVLPAVDALMESQQFVMGPAVVELEKNIAAYCRTPFALGVSSGTDALLLALMGCDLKPGDRVLTTPYTFFATAGCVSRMGARPVFVDIEPDTFNISPEGVVQTLAQMSRSERETTKVLLPVHLYGQCAEMEPLMEVAGHHGLQVIEDAAQAIGAEYNGRRAGSMGDVGCFSFFPSKNLGAFGDGGIVTTCSEQLYERMRILRVHGGEPKYHHGMIGGNFRLDALQAKVVDIKLAFLDGWTEARNRNAEQYNQLFRDAGLAPRITLPHICQDRHIFNQYVIMVPEKRDALRAYLADHQIGCEIYYPIPLHLQACFADLGYGPGDFPVSEQAAQQSLALPIFPELTEVQQGYIVETIQSFFN